MKKSIKLITAILTSAIICSGTMIPVFAAQGPSVHYKMSDVNDDITSMQNLYNKITDKDKKASVYNHLSKLKNYKNRLTKLETQKAKSNLMTTADNTISDTEYLSVGDEVSHSHYSNVLTDNYASVDVTYADSYGFPRKDDFSCETDSNWYGDTPYNAYKITNTGSVSVYGVAVSLSLGGASFSGSTSASGSVTDTESNDWAASNTFDAVWGSTVVSGTFVSSSSVKLYSSSSQDTTTAQLDIYI